ncbi:MAG TPA: glycosyltransferase family 9 protein [Bryobacteraceae bacterium]|nr:glycosyltransferase family 9 protein [Bryobacteraceae bacterium]
MSSILERLPERGRIAVIRIRSMGDCILSTPALSILKRALPDAAIAVVVEDRFQALLEGNPDVSEVLGPEWSAVRKWRPDLCLNLHGGGSSTRITALSGARFRAGFAHFRYAWMYNVRIPRAQEILGVDRKVHTAEHLAGAVFYLGAPRVEIPRARLFAEKMRTPGRPYVVIHPLAAAADKSWPADRFTEVARYLEHAWKLEPVFIGGPGEDLSAFRNWRTVAGAALAEIKSLIAGASLFLGNDSGPAHMAAAFGIPVVVIFGSSDPVVWAPWCTPAEVLHGPGGIHAVSVHEVQDALERLRVRA